MFQRFFAHQQIFAVLLWRIAVMFILFQYARVSFFLFNSDLFPNIGYTEMLGIMKAGLRFDAPALLYTNSLFILLQIIPLKFKYKSGYQMVTGVLFFITNTNGWM